MYRAHAVRPRDANALDRAVWAVTQPIRAGLIAAVEGASVMWRRYVDLRYARSQLGTARVQLRQARGRLDALEAVEAENHVLRTLLELGNQRPDAEPIVAQVIGGGFAAGAWTIEIDRGAVHGLVRGQPVVNASGLVGLVQRSGWTSSEVVLLPDPRSTVLARVARSRLSGRVRGAGDGRGLVMDDVSRDGDVEPGDLVVTSGLGRIFPPNVPIGRVRSLESDGRRRRLELDPVVGFEQLDWVALLPPAPSPTTGPTPELLRPPALWPELRTRGSEKR